MAVTATNLTQGPGTLYTGAFGVSEPADTAVASPPGAGWTDAGGTNDGVTLNVMQEFSELSVDQIVDVPGRRLTKRDMSIATNLAEPTIENLALSMNGGTTATGAGYKSLEPGYATSATQPTYKALLFDGYAPGGFVRRVILRKGLNTSNVEFAYKKDTQTFFTVSFNAHYVSSSIAPFKVIDGT
ncbi:MAG: hypothetical protein M3460_04535 [Actinomycetota bacterium]|nr:hypothetical protein [Actinomycetota bacterium]